MEITSVKFRNFKALREYSLSLERMNVLVGPNNAGKSTIVGAFRALAAAIRKGQTRRPNREATSSAGARWVYRIDAADIPVSLENSHTDYGEGESSVTFRLNNGDSFVLLFPMNGGCRMFVETEGRVPTEPKAFRARYPFKIGVVPVLGPVEHEEPLLQPSTVQAALSTHRASRHFRNYWYHNPEDFELFRELVTKTWPEMDIGRPEISSGNSGPILTMFCREDRIDRELYWVGSGFQIWCQLLTHVMRSRNSQLLVVDEPEIYLHPDMQRQLLSVFRSTGLTLLLATHSSELIAEAEPAEILLVNKKNRSAQRLKNVESLQKALEALGSAHNITLAQLARTRRLVFVEGDDFRLIRRFADRAGLSELASGLGVVAVPVGGFGQWSRVPSTAWAFQNALGQPINLAVILDRDYYCNEQIEEVCTELRKAASFVWVHACKEIENYLLVPAVLDRCVTRAVLDRAARQGVKASADVAVLPILETIVESLRSDAQAQFVGKAMDYHRRPGVPTNNSDISKLALDRFQSRWKELPDRLSLVSGKTALSLLNGVIQEKYGVSITPIGITYAMRQDEVPQAMLTLLQGLERFRIGNIPA